MKTIGVFKSIVLLFLMGGALNIFAQEKQREKVQKSTEVLMEFSKMKETTIPQQLLEQAQGIIIVPNLIKAGLGIGGQRGKGLAMVKSADGTWSDPVFVTLTGGSIGFQAGVQAIDLVLLFKNRATLANIGKGTFSLGGAVSVAAGPVGRSSSANTNTKLDAEVYSYSRSKGLFAGISLNGTSIDVDKEAGSQFYGTDVTASSVFGGTTTASVQPALKSLKETLTSMD